MVLNNMEKIIIDLFTQAKQFVNASADPGKLFHNIVQYHRHLYNSGDHYGYVFRMYVSRTEVCDDILSFNKDYFVNCAYTQLLRLNLFCLYEYIDLYFLLKTY